MFSVYVPTKLHTFMRLPEAGRAEKWSSCGAMSASPSRPTISSLVIETTQPTQTQARQPQQRLWLTRSTPASGTNRCRTRRTIASSTVRPTRPIAAPPAPFRLATPHHGKTRGRSGRRHGDGSDGLSCQDNTHTRRTQTKTDRCAKDNPRRRYSPGRQTVLTPKWVRQARPVGLVRPPEVLRRRRLGQQQKP
ncbi:unnamed protein product [Protopolystoma xenopodis]|uniref:Uncharacterized protein n=1 Tax=Protopolystoma xenopodis TaxID=117903 RepID=A0A448XDZ6_9PLAT|nr:unnamed protein product [Protopolystoma xenopodis]